MAVSQLGVAYLETQDLKNENESLREELLNWKTQFAKLYPASKQREDTGESEQITASDVSTEDSQTDTQRSATKETTAKSSRSKSKSGRKEESKSRVSSQVDREISRLEKERAEEALFSIELPRIRETSRKEKSSRCRTSSAQIKKPGKRVKRVVVEEVEVTEPVDSTAEATGHTRKSSSAEQDLTLLSFIDVSISDWIEWSTF
jgi:hypothetical protein